MNSILKRAVLSSLLMLLCIVPTAQAASDNLITEPIPIHLTAPGTLSSRIGNSKKFLITNLSVSGAMNIHDVQFLREMAGCLDDNWQPTGGHLQHLDLSAASLVAGEDEIRVNLNLEEHMNAYTRVRIYDEKSISTGLFQELTALQSIILPEGITWVGHDSFRCCPALTSVTFPSTLTSIGSQTFKRCTALTEVSLPSQVQTIGYQVFCDCISLRTVTARQGLKDIGSKAFEGCTALTTLNLPSGLRHIESQAFSGCTALRGMSLPTGLKYVGFQAFRGCTALEWVSGYMAADTIDSSAFGGCPSLRTVNLSLASTKYIGHEAFDGCKALREVSLPSTLRLIAEEAFLGCDSIESLTLPANLDSIGEMAFYHCDGLKSLRFLSSNVRMGRYAFANCESLESVTLPEHQTTISNYCFYSCKALKSIDLPYGLTTIDDGAFNNCYNLTSVSLPNTIDSIGIGAFSSCDNLARLTLPSSVRAIGKSAFYGCYKLTSVQCYAPTPPAIGSDAFPKGTFSDATLYVPQGTRLDYFLLDEWGNFGEVREFDATQASITVAQAGTLNQRVDPYWKDKITRLAVSGTLDITDIQCIREMAGCYQANGLRHEGQLQHLDMQGASLTGSDRVLPVYFRNLGSSDARIYTDGSTCYLLAYLEGLRSVELPRSLTAIGPGTFRWCGSLTQVTLPDRLEQIGDRAFQKCAALASLDLPTTLTSIGEEALDGCGSLTTLTLEAGVREIGDFALSDCSGLQTLYAYMPRPVGQGSGTFSGVSDDCVTFVPQGTLTLYRQAPGWSSLKHIVEMGPTEVHLEKAGTLYSQIDPVLRDKISALKVSGPMDIFDIETIRQMAGCYDKEGNKTRGHLQHIDLSGARLTDCGTSMPIFMANQKEMQEMKIGSDGTPEYILAFLDDVLSVALPTSLYTTGSNILRGCGSLTSVTLPASLRSVGDYAFESCHSLQAVDIPSGVTSIGQHAFSGCRSLGTVTLPSGVRTINQSTFAGCSGLRSVTLPSGLKGIAAQAFASCSSLAEPKWPSGLRVIGDYAFAYCDGLKSLTLPSGLGSIGAHAFENCGHMTTVTLPASVREIGSCAFYCCWEVASVYACNPTPVDVSDGGTFKGVSGQCILYVPQGSLDAYRSSAWIYYFSEMREFDATPVGPVPAGQGASEVSRYSTDGQRQTAPARGVSIIRYSDGTVRKVINQ